MLSRPISRSVAAAISRRAVGNPKVKMDPIDCLGLASQLTE